MTQQLLIKLNPERFPNMSLPMAAGLDAEEWAAYLALAGRKLGTRLEAPGHSESSI